MSFKITKAIFIKQFKDTLKNKRMYIQIVMLPIMTFFLKSSFSGSEVANNTFSVLFPGLVAMHISMGPLTGMSSIIAEEKEKNTLRMLVLSGVKPSEFLIGVLSCSVLISLLSASTFLLFADYTATQTVLFLLTCLSGIICSSLLGAISGITSKNQMTASIVAVLVFYLFGLMPFLSTVFNPLTNISKFLYSQSINNILSGIKSGVPVSEFIVVAVNFVIFSIIFGIIYKRKKI